MLSALGAEGRWFESGRPDQPNQGLRLVSLNTGQNLIKGDEIVTPTGKFNVYSKRNDVYWGNHGAAEARTSAPSQLARRQGTAVVTRSRAPASRRRCW
jgi:hypothetical protein